MDDTIGKLLRAGLLASLGEDQERADRLRTASKHLSDGFLSDTRADIPSALLAAVDEGGPSDVPVLKAARDTIVDNWEMFENAFAQQDPSSILRAVTLDAVVAATEADQQVEGGGLVHASRRCSGGVGWEVGAAHHRYLERYRRQGVATHQRGLGANRSRFVIENAIGLGE